MRFSMAVICHEHSEVKFSVETSQTDDSVIDVSFSNVNALFWDRDHETSMECEKDDGESSMDPDMVSIDKTSFKVLPPVAGYLPDLHPDFSVQAVPYCRGFEEKLKSAMLRDDLPGRL